MKPIINILRKTFVIEYYRLNTGFLFLVAMFGFGILRPEDHIALATYAFTSPFLLSLGLCLWGLYHLKVVYFVRQRLLFGSHEFLYHLVTVSKPTRWLGLLYVHFMLWLPVVLYAGFVGYYGWLFGQYQAVIITISFVLLLPLTGVMAYEYRLFPPNPDTRLSILSGFLNRQFTKPYWSYFLLYLFQKAPILLFLTKVFTCFIVYGICKIYPTDAYDARLFSLGAATIGLSHSVMLLHLYEFEHLQLPLLRNLPLTLSQRGLQYTILFILLIFPEFIFMIRYHPSGISWVYTLEWWGLILGLFWVVFGRFLQQHYLMDLLLRQGFYAFISLFFLIMFQIPTFLLAVCSLGAGIYLFHRHYYNSEYIVSTDNLKVRPEE